jgi:hypothetical protein
MRREFTAVKPRDSVPSTDNTEVLNSIELNCQEGKIKQIYLKAIYKTGRTSCHLKSMPLHFWALVLELKVSFPVGRISSILRRRN